MATEDAECEIATSIAFLGKISDAFTVPSPSSSQPRNLFAESMVRIYVFSTDSPRNNALRYSAISASLYLFPKVNLLRNACFLRKDMIYLI